MASTHLTSGIVNWSDVSSSTVAPLIKARSLAGQELSVSVFDLEPDAIVPLHAHPNEEFGYVMSGSLRLVVNSGEAQTLHQGDTFFVASDHTHTAIALESGCRLIECYSPPRIPKPTQESTR